MKNPLTNDPNQKPIHTKKIFEQVTTILFPQRRRGYKNHNADNASHNLNLTNHQSFPVRIQISFCEVTDAFARASQW